MAMQLLRARLLADKVRFVVWLDTARSEADGSPDRAWVGVWEWGLTPNQGETQSSYRARIKAETKLLAQVELAKREAAESGEAGGSSLADEGSAL